MNGFCYCVYSGHAHLTDFNIATIIKDGERATALAGTKPYMGNFDLQLHHNILLTMTGVIMALYCTNTITGQKEEGHKKTLLYSGNRVMLQSGL